MKIHSFCFLFIVLVFAGCADDEGSKDPLLKSWRLVDETTDGISTLGEYSDCYEGDVFHFFKKGELYYLSIDPGSDRCVDEPDLYEYGDIGVFFDPETDLIRDISMPVYVNIPLHPVLYNIKGGILFTPTTLNVDKVDQNMLELSSSTSFGCPNLFCKRVLRFERD